VKFIYLSVCLLLLGCGNNEPSVDNAWIRLPPPGVSVMVGYAVLDNPTNKPLIIKSATSPAFGAVEFHQTRHENDIARMLRHKQLEIPARSKLLLAPGGYHFMLFRPQTNIQTGDHVPFLLHTADGTTLTFEALARNE